MKSNHLNPDPLEAESQESPMAVNSKWNFSPLTNKQGPKRPKSPLTPRPVSPNAASNVPDFTAVGAAYYTPSNVTSDPINDGTGLNLVREPDNATKPSSPGSGAVGSAAAVTPPAPASSVAPDFGDGARERPLSAIGTSKSKNHNLRLTL
jgi:hypothetical protein